MLPLLGKKSRTIAVILKPALITNNLTWKMPCHGNDSPYKAGVALGSVTPVLLVRNLEKSVDYYVRLLGFKVDAECPGFDSVSPAQCGLFLCEDDQGHPGTWVWIDGHDVEAVYQELRAPGAIIRNSPASFPWPLEMHDLDGNVLRLGPDPKNDQPSGASLDMNGMRWAPSSRGGWTRVGQA